MFFNAVNISTSLNVSDGFKGNDLADQFIHLHYMKTVLGFYQDRSSDKNSFTNQAEIQSTLPVGLLL